MVLANRIATFLSACLLFSLMLLVFIDVTGRNLFNRPLPGTSELMELALGVLVFLLLPLVAEREKHITIVLIPLPTEWIPRILSNVCGAFLFAVMSWRLWLMAIRSSGFSDATAVLAIPITPFIYGMSVFAAFTALAFVLRLILGPVGEQTYASRIDPDEVRGDAGRSHRERK